MAENEMILDVVRDCDADATATTDATLAFRTAHKVARASEAIGMPTIIRVPPGRYRFSGSPPPCNRG